MKVFRFQEKGERVLFTLLVEEEEGEVNPSQSFVFLLIRNQNIDKSFQTKKLARVNKVYDILTKYHMFTDKDG